MLPSNSNIGQFRPFLCAGSGDPEQRAGALYAFHFVKRTVRKIRDRGVLGVAVFHLKVSVGSRASGKSALAKSEYIEREGCYAPDREELEHRESENMPEWAEDDPRSYWAAADEHERSNGRLYREVQFALPKELSEDERRELASGFAKRLTEGERLPYTLAIHRGDGENPHAHLMFSERANDGIERSREQWFRRYNAKEPEKGGAQKSRAAMPQAWLEDTRKAWEREANEALERAGYGERIDHRSLADRRDAAERSGDLELAAELSREPNVHLGPMAYRAGDLERAGQGEAAAGEKAQISGVLVRAERVEKDNQELAEERNGLVERIKERIAGIYQEFLALREKIREARERVKAWPDHERQKWVDQEFRRESAKWAEITRKYYQAIGQPQFRTKPTRSTQPTRGPDRDVGPSR